MPDTPGSFGRTHGGRTLIIPSKAVWPNDIYFKAGIRFDGRVIFLTTQSASNKQHYINQTLNNEKWTLPGTRTQITDRQMVDFANTLYGWPQSVYKLGCAFIHLSAMADYNNVNPFSQLPIIEQQDIKQHLHNYHQYPLSDNLSVNTVGPYLLKVLEKISSNLEYEIQRL